MSCDLGTCINGNTYPVHRGYQDHDDNNHPVQYCRAHCGNPFDGRPKNTTDNTRWFAHQAECRQCQGVNWEAYIAGIEV